MIRKTHVFLRGEPPLRETCDLLLPTAMGSDAGGRDERNWWIWRGLSGFRGTVTKRGGTWQKKKGSDAGRVVVALLWDECREKLLHLKSSA